MKAPAFFRTAALRVIKLQTCAPTQSWRDNGVAAKRLRINIQFKLRGLDDPPGLLDPDAGVIVITADPIVPMKIHRRA